MVSLGAKPEEEEPEPELEPEPKVDIEAIMTGLWPFEVPKLSDFGEPVEFYVGSSNVDGELGFLEYKFWYGPEETPENLLEVKGPLLFGYVPQYWYHVDVTTATLKEGVEVIDVGINIQEMDDGFGFYVMINKPKRDGIIEGWSSAHFSQGPSEHEFLSDDKLMFEGISYDFQLDIMELFKTWKLGEGELSIVLDWCESEYENQPGFTKTQNDDTNSTLFEFEWLSPDDSAFESYDYDDDLMQFRYKVHF